jgi:hypothetical protein
MKIYQAVQKVLVGETDRQTGDLISLLSFLESGLKVCPKRLMFDLWLCTNHKGVQRGQRYNSRHKIMVEVTFTPHF